VLVPVPGYFKACARSATPRVLLILDE